MSLTSLLATARIACDLAELEVVGLDLALVAGVARGVRARASVETPVVNDVAAVTER